jgi:hypothetical protein
MNIDLSKGNVGIGTQLPSQPVHLEGNAYISGNITAGNVGMFRNRIINGDMRIDQRNAGNATTNINGSYTLDRFVIYKGGTLTINVQQVATPSTLTGFQKCLKLSVGTQQASLTASDYGIIMHPIEGLNISDFMWGTANAQSITISFWIYASNTGTFSLFLRNGANNRSYVTNYTVSSANTWQYITTTISGDTTGTWAVNNTVGIILGFCFGVGTGIQTTANLWQGVSYIGTSSTTNFFANSVGSAIYITGVQLEKGTIATPFEFRPYQVEFQLCQRYYEKSYDDNVVPGTSSGGVNSLSGVAMDANRLIVTALYKVPKRIAGNVIIYSEGGTVGKFGTVPGGDIGSGAYAAAAGVLSWREAYNPGGGLAAGTAYRVHYTTNSEL